MDWTKLATISACVVATGCGPEEARVMPAQERGVMRIIVTETPVAADPQPPPRDPVRDLNVGAGGSDDDDLPKVLILYQGSRKKDDARLITPLRLLEAEEATERGPRIMAWCHEREARRAFLVERIELFMDTRTHESLKGREAIVNWMRERAAEHKRLDGRLRRQGR